jgi:hypothetical protein
LTNGVASLEAQLAALIRDRDQLDSEVAAVRKAIKALDGKLSPAEFAKASQRSSPRAMKMLK